MNCKRCGGKLVTIYLGYAVCEKCFTGFTIAESNDDVRKEAIAYYRKEAELRSARS